METSILREKFSQIQHLEDFANLLDEIYQSNFPFLYKSEFGRKITSSYLLEFLKKKSTYFGHFTILKKTGDARDITYPFSELKYLHKCIVILLSAIYEAPISVTGFVKNRSIVDNAKLHTNKAWVYNVDLKDFFHSIPTARIASSLKLPPFNLYNRNENEQRAYIGYIIAQLCTYYNYLPQGAPTSPILSNIVCRKLDKKLLAFAKNNKLVYSRYADDITFSTNKYNIKEAQLHEEIIAIIESEKFEINKEKFRIQNATEKQMVTGLVVNKGANISKAYLKDLRFWLMCWEKFGLYNVQARYMNKIHEDKVRKNSLKNLNNYRELNLEFTTDFLIKNIPYFFENNGINVLNFLNFLKGKINFLGLVKGKDNAQFIRFANKFDQLLKYSNQRKPYPFFYNYNKEINLDSFLNNYESLGLEAALNQLDF